MTIALRHRLCQRLPVVELAAAVRRATGQPLRRAAPLSQLAVAGALSCLPDNAAGQPLALLWQSTYGPRAEKRREGKQRPGHRLRRPVARQEGVSTDPAGRHHLGLQQRQHDMPPTKDQRAGAVEGIHQRQRRLRHPSGQQRQPQQQGQEQQQPEHSGPSANRDRQRLMWRPRLRFK